MKSGLRAEDWQRDYPASNTAAVVTITGTPDKRISLMRVVWSYSAAPTGGRLTVDDGATTVMDVDITTGGPGSLPLDPLYGSIGTDMTITLAAGGSGVAGKLSIAAATE